MFAGGLKPWHIIVLVVVLILLFGAKKLPDAARGLGRSLRIFKAETKALTDEMKDKDKDAKAKADEEPSIPDDQPSPINDKKVAQPSDSQRS
ncbi:Sec-independent protein translocase subunit TatA [Fodinicola acaciae]|uniref:Sec-independent protein translocase subunit TatA n=1 Tax=Fodinicola acaciae TaxID=2681555 RepID=UPI0013D4C9F3|nr:Sec-independent protein translocase subunit TatA [Fodinicola acaciae]